MADMTNLGTKLPIVGNRSLYGVEFAYGPAS